MKYPALFLLLALFVGPTLASAADSAWVSDHDQDGAFPLAPKIDNRSVPLAIRYSEQDFKVVSIAAQALANDINSVTGQKPIVWTDQTPITMIPSNINIYIGTLGHSSLIDGLVASGQLDVSAIKDKWESFLITTIPNPNPGLGSRYRLLVIAGSDRRGTAYGAFELSQAIGVSPWYWWADVTPAHRDNLFVAAGTRHFGPPSVQYRGIFINDEDWGMNPWASKTFEPEVGNIGPKTYAKIFELLLRLKANTLWPAMHAVSTAFNAIPENRVVADNYAIVMGSSHCEPMLRNNVGEWKAPANQFNFITNPDGVTKYWEQRVQENGKYENIYTVGIRGIHDDPMMGAKGDAQVVPALEKIFAVQRDLLAKYVNPDPTKVPQIFCPYKEVLAYYLHDLQVPPDVTVVFPDDNFGYIRYFPIPAEIAARPGGFGVYYHISYLGAPFSYVWLNTTPPALIWEEMSKAYDHDMKKLWILNVGDLKPGEIGIDFFLQMAWDINKWNLQTLPDYLTSWATQQFGPEHATEIADVMKRYYRLGYQRKPEELQWNLGREAPRPSDYTYTYYGNEARLRCLAYVDLAAKSAELAAELPAYQQNAFFELVDYPVTGAALANQRFFANEFAASILAQDPAQANDAAKIVKFATAGLANATTHYDQLADGKWKYVMDDDVLLKSRQYRTAALRPAVNLDQLDTTGISNATVIPAGNLTSATPPSIPADLAGQFVESDGVISIEAEHFAKKTDQPGAAWQVIPGLGRTGDAVGVFPTTAPSLDLAQLASAPVLEYPFSLTHPGNVTLHYNLIPTQPIRFGQGLRFAYSIDDQPPQLVTITAGTGNEVTNSAWSRNVLDNSTSATTAATIAAPGKHTLKIYGLDPGVLLEKIVLDAGGLRPSYLGPLETLVTAQASTSGEPSASSKPSVPGKS
jgi:hypothetical protein